MTKLKWMNGEYLKAMDFDRFYEMAEPYIKDIIKKDLDLKRIAAMVKTRIEIFPDIREHVDFWILQAILTFFRSCRSMTYPCTPIRR